MSTIGGEAMTKVSQTINLFGGRGGQIIYEGPTTAPNPTPPATLSGVPISQTQAIVRGGKKTFIVNYEQTNFSTTGVQPNLTVLRRSDASTDSVPIRAHPDCENPEDLDSPPIINGVSFPGLDSYLRPGVVYQRSEYKESQDFSQTSLTAGLGATGVPPGASGGGARNWLKTGLNIQENADNTVVVTETWLYNPEEWPAAIYD